MTTQGHSARHVVVAPRRGRALATLADVLGRVVRTHGWEPRLRQEAAVAAWPAIVGAQLAGQTTALGVRDGTLHVGVSAGVWATQLSYFRTELLQKLRRQGYREVRDLAFHVWQGAGTGRRSAVGVAAYGPSRLPVEPKSEHVATAAQLSQEAGPFAACLASLYLAAQARAQRLSR